MAKPPRSRPKTVLALMIRDDVLRVMA